MASDINLLPEQSNEDKQQVRQRKLVTQVSAIVLILTILTVIGLFAAKVFVQASVNGLDDNIATQNKRIEAKKTEEGIYRALDAKLTSLSTFLASQKHFSTFLSAFSQTVPTSMRLTDLTVNQDNTATISGEVANYADLAGFFAKLRQAGPSQGLSDSTADDADQLSVALPSQPYFIDPLLRSISRDDRSGSINFQIEFTVSSQALAAVSDAS